MFSDPSLRERALVYDLSDKLRPNEIFTIPGSQMDTEAGRQRIFEWVMANYATLASRLPAPFMVGVPRVAGGCDESRLAKAREFFFAPGRKTEGMDKEMARTEEQVRDCIAFREREGATIRTYLAELK